MDETGIQRMETALRAAVDEHRAALRAEIERRTEDFSLRFLLARLGAPRRTLDILLGAAGPDRLDRESRHELTTRLSTEATRLTRLARSASPAYDINRHLAVRRAMRWLETGPERPAIPHRLPASPSAPAALPSGSALNRRFKRSARRKAAPPLPGAAH